MDRPDRRERRALGGIVSIVSFVSEHYDAITFDLLTKTNYTLDDVGGRLSWSALSSFIKNLDTDSALARDLGRSTGWEKTIQTNILLADVFDLLQVINANLVGFTSGGKQKVKYKPYPRPGKEEDKNRIGKGALPLPDLRKWMEEKRNGK